MGLKNSWLFPAQVLKGWPHPPESHGAGNRGNSPWQQARPQAPQHMPRDSAEGPAWASVGPPISREVVARILNLETYISRLPKMRPVNRTGRRDYLNGSKDWGSP